LPREASEAFSRMCSPLRASLPHFITLHTR
jgi:hypothetical protein